MWQIISAIGGTVSILLAWSIPYELKKGKFFLEDNEIIYPGYNRITIFLTLHGLISPWAYFKPWKVKEGWAMLLFSFMLYVLGIYLLISAFN